MLRFPGKFYHASAGASFVGWCAAYRTVFTTPPRMQRQHGERVLGTHGAGLIKHDSMATMEIRPSVAQVQNAAPPADLFRTQVNQGLGTSANDPYVRTLPNQESRPPESSVLQTAAASAPSMGERRLLSQKWGTLQYWLGDSYPRLPIFLEQLLIIDAPPVSAVAERMLQSFSSEVIPALASDREAGTQQKLEMLWSRAVEEYGKVNTLNVFNKEAFEYELDKLHAGYLTEMATLSQRNEGSLALEVLRRKAIEKRNSFLKEGLVVLVQKSSYFSNGDAVWRLFFDSVSAHRKELFSSKARNATLGFVWDALMTEDVVRTPTMTAPVALYLLLVAILQSHSRVPAEEKSQSMHLDEGLESTDQRVRPPLTTSSDPIAKRRFAAEALQDLLNDRKGCAQLVKALRSQALYDLSREAALCEAMLDDQQLLLADIEDLVERFDSTAEVKSLLNALMSGTDSATKAHVSRVLELSDLARQSHQLVDWDAAMTAADWTHRWREHARELLSHPATLESVHRVLRNATAVKSTTRRLFSEEYAAAIEAALRRRSSRAALRTEKRSMLVHELTSYNQIESTLDVLRAVGVSFTELESAAAAEADERRVLRPCVDDNLLNLVLEAVRHRHPSWVKSGVLKPTPSPETRSPLWYLECMTRLYIRLAYVPQAAAALIAQRTRRRIGAVGLECTQFNVPTEMGMVEQYDNLQFKRYDWQGWYQRMLDVHNRNVSIRCRIDDLKRLDAYGNPFVEMQTERRLRILANDRVGVGVLKLDSDKYEDQSDNITYGSTKLSELLAEARKAQLGREYWPSVEVKVRRPSGQSKTYYSVLDDARIEEKSAELYAKYREAKKRSLFVTPMDMWLDVKGMQVRTTVETADAQGYTVDSLQDAMGQSGGV